MWATHSEACTDRTAASAKAVEIRRLFCRPADLNMQDICPPLAHLKDTAIPMMATALSAADGSAAQPSIASIDSRVKVLGTKTRPKRLWITGSDGRRQSFLLKVILKR